jgi:hypothetical protein
MDDFLHIENPRALALISYVMHLRNMLIKIRIRIITPITDSDTVWKRQRKEVSANHGCHKFTHTVMTNAKINIEIREMPLGHFNRTMRCIYRPTPEQSLTHILKL